MRSTSFIQALIISASASGSNALSNPAAKCASTGASREPFTPQHEEGFGRRRALQGILSGIITVATTASAANALDMDAFINDTLETDQKNCNPKRDPKCAPELTKDEAMCKYGQSGELRGEACKRVKAAGGSLPVKSGGKSLGGAYAM